MDLRGAAERALRAAASEGLTLVRASDNATGFRGVKHGERRSKPFQALVWRNGKMQHLGRYATAEEAALAYARELGPEDSKTAAAEAEPAMTAEQVVAAAAAVATASCRPPAPRRRRRRRAAPRRSRRCRRRS